MGFFIGLLIGATVGVFIMAIMNASSFADYEKQKEDKKKY